jgi:hypothetical protein
MYFYLQKQVFKENFLKKIKGRGQCLAPTVGGNWEEDENNIYVLD